MNKRIVKCPFGLLNIAGLMKMTPMTDADGVIGYEIATPLFCHESYKIKPTFNRNLDIEKKFGITEDDGKYYQKRFRRMVLWDFGDGFCDEGYTIEHSYTKPGRYRISCTFYDINRVAWKNSFFIDVVIKEVIPTKLSFVKSLTKDEIVCSKIERITQLEAMLSLTCEEELQVQAKRIFSGGEEDFGRSYQELPDEILKFSRKYWTFLENRQQLVYQSDKIYGDNLYPQDLYTPQYITLYGKFEYNSKDSKNPLNLKIYQVIPYKNIDENLKTIRVLNPNCTLDDLLAHTGSEQDFNTKFTSLIDIEQVYTTEQLPSDASLIGKRAFVDIFYKNDYLSSANKFSFYYDLENKNITKELLSSDNYLNVNPLGMTLGVVNNDRNKVKIGVSLDGFLRLEDDGDDWTIDNYYIDPFLRNGLVKGINLDVYVFPYIPYDTQIVEIEGTDIQLEEGEDKDFVLREPMYYVPKDITIASITPAEYSNGNGAASKWLQDRGVQTIENWLKRLTFSLKDYINCVLRVDVGKTIDVPLHKESLIKPDDITIPTEKLSQESVEELVDTYMSHPMFDETPTIKEFFKLILNGNNFLNYILTKSDHFLDDYANVKTCYLSSLIQTLKMMGEDIYEYEKGAFEGVNDMRDFVRVLSMNHSDLVGHVVKKPYDLTVKRDFFGANVGDEILVDDELTLQMSDQKNNKGKILTLKRNGKSYDMTQVCESGVDVIVQDKYTFETKIVNLRLANAETVRLLDYRSSWGWNLMLPKRFSDCVQKLEANDEYRETHGVNLYSKSELQRIDDIMKELLRGYYSFYVLDPTVENVRTGNFLDEKTITSRIDDVDEWNAKWGFAHEVLMKIIRDRGNLQNGDETDDIQSTHATYAMRSVVHDDSTLTGLIEDEIANINVSVYDGGLADYDKIVEGIVKVYGYLCGGEEDYLELQLVDCCVCGDNKVSALVTESPILEYRIKVDENGVIHPTKQVYKLIGKDYEGTLTVALCGKISKVKGQLQGLLWDVSIDAFVIK